MAYYLELISKREVGGRRRSGQECDIGSRAPEEWMRLRIECGRAGWTERQEKFRRRAESALAIDSAERKWVMMQSIHPRKKHLKKKSVETCCWFNAGRGFLAMELTRREPFRYGHEKWRPPERWRHRPQSSRGSWTEVTRRRSRRLLKKLRLFPSAYLQRFSCSSILTKISSDIFRAEKKGIGRIYLSLPRPWHRLLPFGNKIELDKMHLVYDPITCNDWKHFDGFVCSRGRSFFFFFFFFLGSRSAFLGYGFSRAFCSWRWSLPGLVNLICYSRTFD